MEDLKPSALNITVDKGLSSTPEEAAQDLVSLYNYVTDKAKKAIEWYYVKRNPKRFYGLILRYSAIVLIALAGILPVITTMYPDSPVPAAWASVAVALAALMIAIDRFGGFTSGWIRYVVAAQKLDEALEEFRFTWESNKHKLAGSALSPEELQAVVNNCKDFLQKVQAIVSEETQKWVAEFQSAINDIEASAKVAAETAKASVKAKEEGAVAISVTNGKDWDRPWSVALEDTPAGTYTGNTAALTNLKPGIVKIKITGVIKGAPFEHEQPVIIKGGEITSLTFTL
ncbi:MAG: SLATT domain-containing protein [Bacteroidetes bacterium]|nr:SLATT domain-containing protein [Bacteroidota bacterium]